MALSTLYPDQPRFVNPIFGGQATILPDALGLPKMIAVFASTTYTEVGTGVETAFSYSLPANTLVNNGDMLRITGYSTFAANANNKLTAITFGASSVSSRTNSEGSLAVDRRDIALVIRTGAATQIGVGDSIASGGTATILSSTPTETLSGAIVIAYKIQGGAASDIVAKAFLIEYIPAAGYR